MANAKLVLTDYCFAQASRQRPDVIRRRCHETCQDRCCSDCRSIHGPCQSRDNDRLQEASVCLCVLGSLVANKLRTSHLADRTFLGMRQVPTRDFFPIGHDASAWYVYLRNANICVNRNFDSICTYEMSYRNDKLRTLDCAPIPHGILVSRFAEPDFVFSYWSVVHS